MSKHINKVPLRPTLLNIKQCIIYKSTIYINTELTLVTMTSFIPSSSKFSSHHHFSTKIFSLLGYITHLICVLIIPSSTLFSCSAHMTYPPCPWPYRNDKKSWNIQTFSLWYRITSQHILTPPYNPGIHHTIEEFIIIIPFWP